MEWQHGQMKACKPHIEPYADIRRPTYEGGAIDFIKGMIYKKLEEEKL